MKGHSRAVVCWVLGAGLTAASPAFAKDAGDAGKAESLFAQGAALIRAGHYDEGCPKIEQARELVTGIGVTLYGADCAEHRGDRNRAWTEFKKAEELAEAKSDPRANVARQRAERLRPKLATMAVIVDATARGDDPTITDDGVEVARDAWNTERAVEPRLHRIRVTAADREPWETTVDAAIGRDVAVEVPPLHPAAPPPPRSAAAPVLENAPPWTSSDLRASTAPLHPQRIAAIAALGVGAVGLGIGAIFGMHAKSLLDESNANGHCSDDRCNAAGLSERSDAISAATLSTIGFVAGAVLISGGVVLYVTTPEHTPAVSLVPRVEHAGASLLLQRRW